MSEIEDFLRKAAQRRKDRKKKSPPTPPAAQETSSFQAAPMQSMPVQPPPATHGIGTSHPSVQQSVEQHIDTTRFQSRASHITDDIDFADERMDEHLHEKFDHSIGNLRETKHAAPAPTSGGTNLIADLFANRQSIRQAFIMSEVMRPVADRDDNLRRS